MAASSMPKSTFADIIPAEFPPPREIMGGLSRIGQHQAAPGVYPDSAYETMFKPVKAIPLLEMEVPFDPAPQFQL